jgi:hypothetical protein
VKIFTNIDQRAAKVFEIMAAQLGCTDREGPLVRSGKFAGGVMTISYKEKRRFFSRIYKLSITLKLSCKEAPVGTAVWKKGNMWTGDYESEKWLCRHPRLSKLASLIDLEMAGYSRCSREQDAVISLVTLPGCFIWTLIPPMHYFVKLTGLEIEHLSSLLMPDVDKILIQGQPI